MRFLGIATALSLIPMILVSCTPDPTATPVPTPSPTPTSSRFDSELLLINVPAVRVVDKEGQLLEIDAFVRYRIRDPLVFLEYLLDENTAGVRIGNFAIAAIRNEVAMRVGKDIIGGGDDYVTREDGSIIVSPRLTQDGTPTGKGMMGIVINDIRARAEADFGVEIVDVFVVFELR